MFAHLDSRRECKCVDSHESRRVCGTIDTPSVGYSISPFGVQIGLRFLRTLDVELSHNNINIASTNMSRETPDSLLLSPTSSISEPDGSGDEYYKPKKVRPLTQSCDSSTHYGLGQPDICCRWDSQKILPDHTFYSGSGGVSDKSDTAAWWSNSQRGTRVGSRCSDLSYRLHRALPREV